jgi:hypothetical protein
MTPTKSRQEAFEEEERNVMEQMAKRLQEATSSPALFRENWDEFMAPPFLSPFFESLTGAGGLDSQVVAVGRPMREQGCTLLPSGTIGGDRLLQLERACDVVAGPCLSEDPESWLPRASGLTWIAPASGSPLAQLASDDGLLGPMQIGFAARPAPAAMAVGTTGDSTGEWRHPQLYFGSTPRGYTATVVVPLSAGEMSVATLPQPDGLQLFDLNRLGWFAADSAESCEEVADLWNRLVHEAARRERLEPRVHRLQAGRPLLLAGTTALRIDPTQDRGRFLLIHYQFEASLHLVPIGSDTVEGAYRLRPASGLDPEVAEEIGFDFYRCETTPAGDGRVRLHLSNERSRREQAYFDRYPDIAASHYTAMPCGGYVHFCRHGRSEGRKY